MIFVFILFSFLSVLIGLFDHRAIPETKDEVPNYFVLANPKGTGDSTANYTDNTNRKNIRAAAIRGFKSCAETVFNLETSKQVLPARLESLL